MPADPRVNVGVAAIVWLPTFGNEPDLFLQIQRAGQAAEEPGTYSTPGGWIDHGEDPMTAAVREVYEETGVRAWVSYDFSKVLGITTHTNEINGNTVICPWVNLYARTEDSVLPEPPEPDKCQNIRWATARSLYELAPEQLFTPTRLAREAGYFDMVWGE